MFFECVVVSECISHSVTMQHTELSRESRRRNHDLEFYKGDGKECPDRSKNTQLYTVQEDCTIKKCESEWKTK